MAGYTHIRTVAIRLILDDGRKILWNINGVTDDRSNLETLISILQDIEMEVLEDSRISESHVIGAVLSTDDEDIW